jgi:hypothetical protein
VRFATDEVIAKIQEKTSAIRLHQSVKEYAMTVVPWIEVWSLDLAKRVWG